MTRFRLITHIVILAALLNPCLTNAQDDHEFSNAEALASPEVQGALAAIDAWIQGVQTYEKVPGISVGIVRGQDLIWAKGYGYSNPKTKRPADENTLYSICSISKLFTSIGIMQLRDANKLELRDPVSKHLDWFNITQSFGDSGPITIESLLTHSSGLPRESDFSYWLGSDYAFPTRDQLIDKLKTQTTLYPAQRTFQYSNLALSLAGEIIQKESQQDYEDYIKQNILEPLQLVNTRPYYPEKMRGKELAIGYSGVARSGERSEIGPFFTRGITAAAGFTSSVYDLAKFASWQFRLLQGGVHEVLDANTLREMQRVHWVDPDWETTWGLGFTVEHVGESTVVGHSGGCPGYITNVDMIPKDGLAVIALTNAGDGPATKITRNVLETFGAALKNIGSPVETEVPDLSKYVGNYDVYPWGGELAIRQWGDHLIAFEIPSRDLGKAIEKLTLKSGDTFTRVSADGEDREDWLFELGNDGKAQRIVLHSQNYARIK